MTLGYSVIVGGVLVRLGFLVGSSAATIGVSTGFLESVSAGFLESLDFDFDLFFLTSGTSGGGSIFSLLLDFFFFSFFGGSDSVMTGSTGVSTLGYFV